MLTFENFFLFFLFFFTVSSFFARGVPHAHREAPQTAQRREGVRAWRSKRQEERTTEAGRTGESRSTLGFRSGHSSMEGPGRGLGTERERGRGTLLEHNVHDRGSWAPIDWRKERGGGGGGGRTPRGFGFFQSERELQGERQ